MKKAAIFFAAAVLVLTLAACGSRDSRNNGTMGSDVRQAVDDVGNDVRRAMDDVGSDASRAMDNAGNTAGDLLTGDNAAASRTSFQRMLDNARVHDTDGILTDGENSRW